MTGGDLVIKFLIENGVSKVFGYPGGAAMPLYDSLARYRGKIKHIRTCHEQGAAHAADGYARISGELGVVFATSGPGATNLITGIATAYADSVPLLVITANVRTAEIGTDSFQEADITGMTLSVTKYNWCVKSPEKLVPTLEKAVKLAKYGRPGPVLVDIPTDILSHIYKKSEIISTCDETEMRLDFAEFPEEEEIDRAAEVINNAKKPFIIFGGGIAISGDTAKKYAIELAEKICAPTAFTLMCAGVLPRDNPLNVGMIGKYGLESAKEAVKKSDVIIAIGMRFSNRTHEFAEQGKKIIHIDADRAEINKNVVSTNQLCGDAGKILESLLPKIEAKSTNWLKKTDKNTENSEICEIFKQIADFLEGNEIVVSDVGSHQMAVANYYPFSGKHRFLTSGGFGTMGFGLAASIGAKIAKNDSEVVLITGDGSLKMSAGELLTLRENKIKILIVVLNNGALGMVRDMQKNDFGGRFIATDSKIGLPNFVKVASGYGLKGKICKNPEELASALNEYANSKQSYLIDYRGIKL